MAVSSTQNRIYFQELLKEKPSDPDGIFRGTSYAVGDGSGGNVTLLFPFPAKNGYFMLNRVHAAGDNTSTTTYSIALGQGYQFPLVGAQLGSGTLPLMYLSGASMAHGHVGVNSNSIYLGQRDTRISGDTNILVATTNTNLKFYIAHVELLVWYTCPRFVPTWR